MSENLVGMHIYKLTIHRTRKPATIKLERNGEGAGLFKLMPDFISAFSSPMNLETGFARSWYLRPEPDEGFSRHGLVMYGSSGFESEIVDRKTRELRFERKVTDMDVIPLYYRIWVPESGDFALIALQTYGNRSCVMRVLSSLVEFFRDRYDGLRLTSTPVVAMDIQKFREGEVKSISLLKQECSSDSAENQLGNPNELVDLNIRFTAKRRSNLGLLGEVVGRIRSGSSDQALTYNSTVFDSAFADVMIGGRRRKITLVGLDKDTGKIDLSDEVRRQANGHPNLSSIRDEVHAILEDVAAGPTR